jgi:hypothetical protein
MVDYVALAATAERLINANGRDVTIVQKDRTPADANKPHRGGGASDTSVGPVKAVIIPFSADDVDGTLIRRNDKRAYVAANDTGVSLIEQFDTLTDGSDTWRIEAVDVINPGATRLLYDIQLRQ